MNTTALSILLIAAFGFVQISQSQRSLCDSKFQNPWGSCGEVVVGGKRARCEKGLMCVADSLGQISGSCMKEKPSNGIIICPAEDRRTIQDFIIYPNDPDTRHLRVSFNSSTLISSQFENCGRDVKDIAGNCGPKYGNFRCKTGEFCSKHGYCGIGPNFINGDCPKEERPNVKKFVFTDADGILSSVTKLLEVDSEFLHGGDVRKRNGQNYCSNANAYLQLTRNPQHHRRQHQNRNFARTYEIWRKPGADYCRLAPKTALPNSDMFADCGRDVRHASGKCGPKHNNFRCDIGYACSKNGFCGNTTDYTKESSCPEEIRRNTNKLAFDLGLGFVRGNWGQCDQNFLDTGDVFWNEHSMRDPQHHRRQHQNRNYASTHEIWRNPGAEYCRLTSKTALSNSDLFKDCGRDVRHATGQCGPKHNNFRCDIGYACSERGYCGNTADYTKKPSCPEETRPNTNKLAFDPSLGFVRGNWGQCDQNYLDTGNVFRNQHSRPVRTSG